MTHAQNIAARGWQAARIGCHWSRGRHTISTYSQGDASGYALYHLPDEPQYFATWAEAEQAADRRRVR